MLGTGTGVFVVGGGQSRSDSERQKLSQQSGFGKAQTELWGGSEDLSPHPCRWVLTLLADHRSGP